MRTAQVERAADEALRALRRLSGMAERGGFLMLGMAASVSIGEIEDAKQHEIEFRRDRELGA
jgi:hypothetical protein